MFIDGIDYTAAQDVVVTFLPGEDCVLVNVGITDDSINEENETFIGILKSLDATPSNVLIGAPSRAIGTIINDDPISKYNLYIVCHFTLQLVKLCVNASSLYMYVCIRTWFCIYCSRPVFKKY